MRRISPSMASAVGGLILLAVPAAGAQRAPAAGVSIIPVASLEVQTPGSISGVVRDEHGTPVPGAMVSVLGPSTAFALTGPDGRFELASLPPGPYLVRVHVAGFTPLRGEILEVRSGAHVTSQLALRHVPEDAAAAPAILAAGVGGAADAAATSGDGADAAAPGDAPATTPDEGETAWRLRHARRSILKDGVVPVAVVADAGEGGGGRREGALGRAVESPVRAASDFFSMPLTREVNLLTASSFNDPSQLFQGDTVAHGIAYVSLGAPAGRYADWTVRGAMTQGDLASWIVAGSYLTRPDAPGRHRYDVKLSYSTERYDGGNPEALRAVSDGSRNVGTVAGYDTFAINKTLSIDYGARYAHFDYLDGRSLISPRVGLTVAPTDHFRVTTVLLRRALAPGAEEFAPPMEGGIYLPPQRTFSSLASDDRLRAEHTTGVDVGVEHDLGDNSAVSAHAYRQHVDNELATLFGVDLPDQPAADVGHYFVGSAGNVDLDGWSAGFRTAVSDHVRGSVEYLVECRPLGAGHRHGVPGAARAVGGPKRHRADSRSEHDPRDRHAGDGDAHPRALPSQQRLQPRRRERGSVPRFALRRAGAAVAPVHGFQHGEVGNARRRAQLLPGSGARPVGLRRAPRRPPPQAYRRRPDGPVLERIRSSGEHYDPS